MDLRSLSIKSAFNNMFKPKRSRRSLTQEPGPNAGTAAVESPSDSQDEDDEPLDLLSTPDRLSTDEEDGESRGRSPHTHRALPPVPDVDSDSESDEEVRKKKIRDYAGSIERVKDCGWYWGSVSGSRAEKLLSSEPDGSFIVRDSSNENYIFSLSFKLDGSVRHVRIEQDQGQYRAALMPPSPDLLLLLTLT